MEFPLVSIIVPMYNAAGCIARCIKSICAQSYKSIEIILLNDGSKDGTLSVCRALAAQDHRIALVDKPNSGAADTRNQGLALAHGRYVQFVDSDDWLAPDFTEKLVTAAETHTADRVLWNKLYRRDLLAGHGIRFRQELFAEDQLFNTEYLRYVRTAVSIPDIGYYYLQCSQSVSHSRVTTADILRLRRRVMGLYKSIYTELGIYPETRAAILRSAFGENEFTLPPLDTPQAHSCRL